MQTPWHRLWRAMPNASRRTRRRWVVAALTGYPLMTVGYALLVPTGRASSIFWGPIAIDFITAFFVVGESADILRDWRNGPRGG